MIYLIGDRVRVAQRYGDEATDPEDKALVGLEGVVVELPRAFDTGVRLEGGDGFPYYFNHEELEPA